MKGILLTSIFVAAISTGVYFFGAVDTAIFFCGRIIAVAVYIRSQYFSQQPTPPTISFRW
jgi:hypothetical protein